MLIIISIVDKSNLLHFQIETHPEDPDPPSKIGRTRKTGLSLRRHATFQ